MRVLSTLPFLYMLVNVALCLGLLYYTKFFVSIEQKQFLIPTLFYVYFIVLLLSNNNVLPSDELKIVTYFSFIRVEHWQRLIVLQESNIIPISINLIVRTSQNRGNRFQWYIRLSFLSMFQKLLLYNICISDISMISLYILGKLCYLVK